METRAPQITELLKKYEKGDQDAINELLPILYKELRKLAQSYLKSERPNHTLQATALVHEAYIKLLGQNNTEWKNRSHFFGVAAQTMRRILVDHARKNQAVKRGSGVAALELEEADALDPSTNPETILQLDKALEGLKAVNERYLKVVELRYFAGLPLEEVAEVLGTSLATVKRDWSFSKAWLYRELAIESTDE